MNAGAVHNRVPLQQRLRWTRLMRSLSTKLILVLVAGMIAIFSLLGYVNIRLHRTHLEDASLLSAERVSDVIKRSTSYYMLRNDREGLYHIISTIGREPGMVRIRIFNQQGRISFSTDPAEVNRNVDKNAEACYGCHEQAQPLVHLTRPDRFRIYRQENGLRILGVINPIENLPSCSSAPCHAHPPLQKILGVLDTNLSLERADAGIAESSRQMLGSTLAAVAIISLLCGLFVWRVVHGPLKLLKSGAERLSDGELGLQIDLDTGDEMGEVAASFNRMSRDLGEARKQAQAWAQTLEARVDQKTRELRAAHEHMLQAEKMASLGKLAAAVAHELNNPLSGILTYAKLLKKWLARPDPSGQEHEKVLASLDLVETEIRRCGDIVKNLLTFARAAPMNLDWADLNAVVRRCVRLVQHQLEMNAIQLQLNLAEALPRVHCDPAQIEQVILALTMNAIDAMPGGGVLTLASATSNDRSEVCLRVQDDGVGIPPELLANLFEPFFTTKEKGNGVGLGLAISHGVVERHHGRIEVESAPGHGTIFSVILPVGRPPSNSREAAGPVLTAEER